MATPSLFTVNEETSAVYTCALLDEQDFPVPASTLNSLTLKLYNQLDGSIINSRNVQNVLNANNVIVGNTTAISISAVGSPGVFQTVGAHGLATGQTVTIKNHVGASPNVSGQYLVFVLDPVSFSLNKVGTKIPVNLTVGGSSGTVTGGVMWSIQPLDNIIVDDRRPAETHVAVFDAHWGSTSRLVHEVLLIVTNVAMVT